MKNNWLLYGIAAFLVVRYLKNRNNEIVVPNELLPFKPGSGTTDVPTAQMAPQERGYDGQITAITTPPTPPSQGFKPGQL